MGHSAGYPQCLATTCLVKRGKGVVTWFSMSANHMHSARAFLILFSAFRILLGLEVTSSPQKARSLRIVAIQDTHLSGL